MKEPGTAAATEAKKLKTQQQKKTAGNQAQCKSAGVDPKKVSNTPTAQRQTAAASMSGRPRPVGTKGVEMSREKDVYEELDPEIAIESTSIYEETF